MSDFPPELTLIAARINIQNMSVYANAMLLMVNLGVKSALTEDGFFRRSFLKLDPNLDEESLEELETLMSGVQVESALGGAKAAALIFLHAGLESCLHHLLTLTAQLDIPKWKSLIPDKKVSLLDVEQRGIDAIMHERIEIYLATVRRDSLLAKCVLLLRILQPESGIRGGFVYDSKRLELIESLRNDCAHGRVGIAEFSQIKSNLNYLHDVGTYFVDLVAAKYNIKLDETETATNTT